MRRNQDATRRGVKAQNCPCTMENVVSACYVSPVHAQPLPNSLIGLCLSTFAPCGRRGVAWWTRQQRPQDTVNARSERGTYSKSERGVQCILARFQNTNTYIPIYPRTTAMSSSIGGRRGGGGASSSDGGGGGGGGGGRVTIAAGPPTIDVSFVMQSHHNRIGHLPLLTRVLFLPFLHTFSPTHSRRSTQRTANKATTT